PRTPPPPTLFPYTTLFRSSGRAAPAIHPQQHPPIGAVHICDRACGIKRTVRPGGRELRLILFRQIDGAGGFAVAAHELRAELVGDRKSTRLNSSHVSISYA